MLFGSKKGKISKADKEKVLACYNEYKQMVMHNVLDMKDEIQVLDEVVPVIVRGTAADVREVKLESAIKAFVKFCVIIEAYEERADSKEGKINARIIIVLTREVINILISKLNEVAISRCYTEDELVKNAIKEMKRESERNNTEENKEKDNWKVYIADKEIIPKEEAAFLEIIGNSVGYEITRRKTREDFVFLEHISKTYEEILRQNGMYADVAPTDIPLPDLLKLDIIHCAIWAASLDGKFKPEEAVAICDYTGVQQFSLEDIIKEHDINKKEYERFETHIPPSFVAIVMGDFIMKDRVNDEKERFLCSKVYYKVVSIVTAAVIACDLTVDSVEMRQRQLFLKNLSDVFKEHIGEELE